MKLPTYAEHKRFCEVDGWELTADRPGRKVRSHYVYIKVLRNGEVLRTQVSKGRGSYRDPKFWRTVRSTQLRVSEEDFWQAVTGGIPPEREEDKSPRPHGNSLPFNLVVSLREAGFTLAELSPMTRDEAIAAWNYYLTYRKKPEV